MPTVSLTPQQQATVDAANKKLADAQSYYDSSKSHVDSEYNTLQKQWNNFKNAKCKYTYQASLEDQINGYGTLDPQSCGQNAHCSPDKCQTYVIAFNHTFGIWKVRKLNLDSAKVNLDKAKQELQDVLDAIAKDPTIASNTSIINNEIEAQKKKDMIKWLFFGLAAVVIIGAALFLGRKLLSSKASS